jgi:hypothetical protein
MCVVFPQQHATKLSRFYDPTCPSDIVPGQKQKGPRRTGLPQVVHPTSPVFSTPAGQMVAPRQGILHPMTSAVAVNVPSGDHVSEIIIGGSRHLPAREIARSYGYVSDYVSRLCRQSKVRGRRLGKLWYVDTESFAAFVRDQAHGPTLSPNPQEPTTKPAV